MTKNAQALVETAIIAPVVIFFMLGVFEVGWALRSYLILANLNREAARYAVRTNVLHFDNIAMPEYEKVVTHTLDSLNGELDIDFKDKGTMIISFIHASIPCTLPYTVTSPLNIPTYTAKFPATSTHQTRINYADLITDLVRYQKEYSCQRADTPLIALDNDVVIVELFMEHQQLLGFPVLSNSLTDPILLYGSTYFRRIQEFRN
jgi:hypothetical protein